MPSSVILFLQKLKAYSLERYRLQTDLVNGFDPSFSPGTYVLFGEQRHVEMCQRLSLGLTTQSIKRNTLTASSVLLLELVKVFLFSSKNGSKPLNMLSSETDLDRLSTFNAFMSLDEMSLFRPS